MQAHIHTGHDDRQLCVDDMGIVGTYPAQHGDREVTHKIARHLARPVDMSSSRLLRQLRDAGYAREQQRFAQLTRGVAGPRR